MDSVYLTVAFCPTPFTGLGAVVRVNSTTADFTVSKTFELPGSTGCPALKDGLAFVNDVRTRDFPPPFGGRSTHLSDSEAFGQLSVVDLDGGKISHTATARGAVFPSGLFDGFTSFAIHPDGHKYIGVTPHVMQDGWCSDGCFRFGQQNISSGRFDGINPLPFKAVMNSVKFHDEKRGIYYAQGNYPLQPEAFCSDRDTDQCMFSINSTTGELLASKPTPKFQVYHYEDALATGGSTAQDGTVLAWAFMDECGEKGGEGGNSYGFARVHLATATYKKLVCLQKGVVVHQNPNQGGFSHDNKRFATASGNAYTGEMQLLVFDVETGNKVIESSLPTLKKALKVSDVTPFIKVWGAAHMS